MATAFWDSQACGSQPHRKRAEMAGNLGACRRIPGSHVCSLQTTTVQVGCTSQPKDRASSLQLQSSVSDKGQPAVSRCLDLQLFPISNSTIQTLLILVQRIKPKQHLPSPSVTKPYQTNSKCQPTSFSLWPVVHHLLSLMCGSYMNVQACEWASVPLQVNPCSRDTSLSLTYASSSSQG